MKTENRNLSDFEDTLIQRYLSWRWVEKIPEKQTLRKTVLKKNESEKSSN